MERETLGCQGRFPVETRNFRVTHIPPQYLELYRNRTKKNCLYLGVGASQGTSFPLLDIVLHYFVLSTLFPQKRASDEKISTTRFAAFSQIVRPCSTGAVLGGSDPRGATDTRLLTPLSPPGRTHPWRNRARPVHLVLPISDFFGSRDHSDWGLLQTEGP